MKNLISILPEEVETLKFADEELPKFLAIYFIKENGSLKFNPFKSPTAISFVEETVNKNGKDYLLLIYDLKGNLLEEIYFSPGYELNYDILTIPYHLNIGKLELINLKNNMKEIEDLSALAICNENNICETGEENLCPLDCKTAKNPYYPFTQTIDKYTITQPTKMTEKLPVEYRALAPPSSVFANIFLISIIVIGIISLSVFIIYLIKKKR